MFNQMSEEDAKAICDKFFNVHQWEKLLIINHSLHGYNPLIILNKETVPNTVHLYDNYLGIVKDIRPVIENDLQINKGYSESFYLSYEDIDNLQFQKYVNREKDAEKIIDISKHNINA